MSFTLWPWRRSRTKGGRLPSQTRDRVALRLPGLAIAVERAGAAEVPAELTVVVPRAELRAKLNRPHEGEATVEVILNSITIAHSPRHAPEQRVSRESGRAGT